MARRRSPAAGMDSYADLARKAEILERELAVQRQALDRLKQMGSAPKTLPQPATAPAIRKTA